MLYTLGVYFVSGVGPCTGIVEPFKHLLRVTAHPQFLALELRTPMGACSGQYGTIRYSKFFVVTSQQLTFLHVILANRKWTNFMSMWYSDRVLIVDCMCDTTELPKFVGTSPL